MCKSVALYIRYREPEYLSNNDEYDLYVYMPLSNALNLWESVISVARWRGDLIPSTKVS